MCLKHYYLRIWNYLRQPWVFSRVQNHQLSHLRTAHLLTQALLSTFLQRLKKKKKKGPWYWLKACASHLAKEPVSRSLWARVFFVFKVLRQYVPSQQPCAVVDASVWLWQTIAPSSDIPEQKTQMCSWSTAKGHSMLALSGLKQALVPLIIQSTSPKEQADSQADRNLFHRTCWRWINSIATRIFIELFYWWWWK